MILEPLYPHLEHFPPFADKFAERLGGPGGAVRAEGDDGQLRAGPEAGLPALPGLVREGALPRGRQRGPRGLVVQRRGGRHAQEAEEPGQDRRRIRPPQVQSPSGMYTCDTDAIIII